MQELQRGKADIVACSFKRFLGEKVEVLPKEKINDEDAAVVLPRKNYISTQTIVGKAECFKENLFDDSLPRFQDWELVIRLAQKYKIHFIEQPLVNVYVQEDSITKKPEKAIIALERIMNKHKDIFDNDPKAKAGFYILLGDVYMQMDNYNECYYTKALRNDMFNYKTYIRILLFYYNKIVKLLK